MGGLGSTRWNDHTKRRLVEDCLVLDLSQLNRAGLFDQEVADGVLRWTDPRTDAVLFSAYFVMEPLENGERALAIGYRARRDTSTEKVLECFFLEPHPPHFGGLRWFARCPGCQSRRTKLHLPPGEARFLCRACHDLTHLSVQDHDKRVDQLKRDPAARAAIREGRVSSLASARTAELVMKTLPRWAQPFPKRPWPGPSDARLSVEPSERPDPGAPPV
jgi:hypothetical protein